MKEHFPKKFLPTARVCAVFAGAFFLVQTPARADLVELANGDRLSGTVESMADGQLVLATPYAGKIKLPWAQISHIASEAPVRVRLADGSEYDGKLETTDGEPAIRLAGLDAAAPLTLARVAALNPPRHPERTQTHGRITVGGNMASGNTESSSLHVAGEFVARNPSQQIRLDGEINEAEQNGANTASNWRTGLKYDHFLRDDGRGYWYVNNGFARDRRADLDLRATLGAGAGRFLIDEKTLKVSLEGGATLVHETYGSGVVQRFPGARAALRYDHTLLDGRLALYHSSEVLVNLDDAKDTLWLTRTGARLPMTEQLGVSAEVKVDYDNVPAAGKKKTDTTFVVGMDYSL